MVAVFYAAIKAEWKIRKGDESGFEGRSFRPGGHEGLSVEETFETFCQKTEGVDHMKIAPEDKNTPNRRHS